MMAEEAGDAGVVPADVVGGAAEEVEGVEHRRLY